MGLLRHLRIISKSIVAEYLFWLLLTHMFSIYKTVVHLDLITWLLRNSQIWLWCRQPRSARILTNLDVTHWSQIALMQQTFHFHEKCVKGKAERDRELLRVTRVTNLAFSSGPGFPTLDNALSILKFQTNLTHLLPYGTWFRETSN